METKSQIRPQLSKEKKIKIQINPPQGHVEQSKFFSQTITQSYEGKQLVRETEETLEFIIETSVSKKISPNKVQLVLQALKKEGPGDLRDMGFPEENELLDLLVTRQGRVLKAGHYPSNSIFFVSPTSLPDREVKVGDTWDYKFDWVSLKNKIPLRINLVSILRNIYQCGNEMCAVVKISGVIKVLASMDTNLNLRSQVEGLLLINTQTGSVIWSEIKNQETLSLDEEQISVRSCLESVLIQPKFMQWPWRKRPSCDPTLPVRDFIPGVSGV